MIDRIMALYSETNQDDRTKATTWYRDAHSKICKLSCRYELPEDIVAAVIAVISPSCSWETNLQEAEKLIACWKHEDDPDDVHITTYGLNKLKALSILTNHNVDTDLRGCKVRAFYDNILNPTDSQQVTIDSHMLNCLHGDTRSTYWKKPHNSKLQNAFRTVAYHLCLQPHQLQAAIWLMQKRTTQEVT